MPGMSYISLSVLGSGSVLGPPLSQLARVPRRPGSSLGPTSPPRPTRGDGVLRNNPAQRRLQLPARSGRGRLWSSSGRPVRCQQQRGSSVHALAGGCHSRLWRGGRVRSAAFPDASAASAGQCWVAPRCHRPGCGPATRLRPLQCSPRAAGCNVYVSEGRDHAVLAFLQVRFESPVTADNQSRSSC